MKRSGVKEYISGILLLLFWMLTACNGQNISSEYNPYREWRVYHGDHSSSKYSELAQINTENVQQLEVAWIYHSGDKNDFYSSQIQCSPIVANNILYGVSPGLKAFAVDAATGKEIWQFNPFQHDNLGRWSISRGVAYWEDGSGNQKRILFTAGPKLFSLDAATGKPDTDFGKNGLVRLDRDLDRKNTEGLEVFGTTPGTVYKNLYIIGSRVSEEALGAPGHIRAFDIRTGERKWIFHTIPQPGEFGYDTWPENAYQRAGGANSWSGLSLDVERGMVFVPTGSPAFDFYGGDRPGKNLFGNCLIALNADTGERIWHFQFVHHDIWDRDLPAPPNLLTVTHDGKKIDAVAQITKSGHVFVFNRETGEPLFPIEEKPYPPSDLRGEQAWPTQPLPPKPPPFARQQFLEADVTNISPESYAYVLERLRKVRSGGQFVPPSVEGTVIFPGFDGGAEWGGAAVDPESAILYANSNEMPWILTMVDLDSKERLISSYPGKNVYMTFCARCHGINMDGRGRDNYPPLANLSETYSKSDIIILLNTGKGEMPAFPMLTEAQKADVADFLLQTYRENKTTFRPQATSRRVVPEIPYSHTGYNRFFDQYGYPAIKPPWGTLNAINLNSGEIEWQVPLGEFPELTAKGIPPTGTENYGGPVVTAGGLVFIGASKDEKFRAFDKKSGEVLWETQLPAGGYATPCTYEVQGKQYVVIAAGGGKMGTKSGDAYVAFALPK